MAISAPKHLVIFYILEGASWKNLGNLFYHITGGRKASCCWGKGVCWAEGVSLAPPQSVQLFNNEPHVLHLHTLVRWCFILLK